MQYWDDQHPNPNIDISYVSFTGRELLVPAGAEWCSTSDCKAVLM